MIRVAGVGPGDPRYLTEDVREQVQRAKVVLAFRRVEETLRPLRDDIQVVKTRAEILDWVQREEDLLILASGDPVFYGITDYLKREGVKLDAVHPGLSSIQYMCAKLQISWQNALLYSLHGREEEILCPEDKVLIFLTDRDHGPNHISRLLKEKGRKGTLYAGFDLSYETEKIKQISIGEEMEEQSSLAVVIVV